MTALALLIGASVGCLAASARCWWERMNRLIEAPSPAEPEDEARLTPGPSRAERLDAVAALCFSSGPYVAARLAPYESEVSDLAELVLELDDQSPKPSGPAED